jgi:putative methylase
LRKALEVSSVVYSIHNASSLEFIKKFISPAVITDYRMIDFPIKRTFSFHTKEVQVIKVEIYRIEKRLEGLLLESRERKPQAEESL